MRRSLCFTEPKTVFAGSTGNWKFHYKPSHKLSKGARLKLDLMTTGKDMNWSLPTSSETAKENVLWLELPNKKKAFGKPVKLPKGKDYIPSQFEFVLPMEIDEEETLIFCLGAPDARASKSKGNVVQHYVQRRRPFYLYVDPKGKGDYKEHETFTIDVKGGELANIRVLVPSLVAKNQRFDITVRFEDAFGNLTGLAPEDTLIELTYEQLRDNINWKLFVPETGFISLPNLYFNEVGVYRIELKNLATKNSFFSPPIRCESLTDIQAYWGTLHTTSRRFNANDEIETHLRYFRDERAYQFYGTSNPESEKETPNDVWKQVTAQVAEFNEEERFVTLLGFNWCGDKESEGMRQFVYLKDNKPILRKKDAKSNALKKVYKTHTPKDLLSIPTMTMASKCVYDFKQFNSEYEKVVEIYNGWGSSECTKKEGNTRPITPIGKKGMSEKKEGSIRNALNKGCRFGFIAGGYNFNLPFDDVSQETQTLYSAGATAVLSTAHTREALMRALARRSCFATTGARMLIGIQIAEQPMGSELKTSVKPGLAFNRHITGYALGTSPLKEVVLVRNGKVIKTFKEGGNLLELTIDDMDPIEKIALDAPDKESHPFAYYYLRATQEDGHIAWSSPIWVDHDIQEEALVKKGKK